MMNFNSLVFAFIATLSLGCGAGITFQSGSDGAQKEQEKSAAVSIKPGKNGESSDATKPVVEQDKEVGAASAGEQKNENDKTKDEIATKSSDDSEKQGELDTKAESNISADRADKKALEVQLTGLNPGCNLITLLELREKSVTVQKSSTSGGWGSSSAKATKETTTSSTGGWGSSKATAKQKGVDAFVGCIKDGAKGLKESGKVHQYLIVKIAENKFVDVKPLAEFLQDGQSDRGGAGYGACRKVVQQIEGNSDPIKFNEHVCSTGACCLKLF